jgi:hypothetical protein
MLHLILKVNEMSWSDFSFVIKFISPLMSTSASLLLQCKVEFLFINGDYLVYYLRPEYNVPRYVIFCSSLSPLMSFT